jgi:hypothetical protein
LTTEITVNCVASAPLSGDADMALTVYTSKDNAWREYVNPLRGMTLKRMTTNVQR